MLTGNLLEFYTSSPMREGVLCWYTFRHDASILDLSGGVLSDMLKERCRCVLIGESSGSETFDYIVVLDPQDFSVETLSGYRNKLKSHGRLLLAYENPFALRYWSGKESPVTKLPYDPLFGHDERPSAAELRVRLNLAGFEGQKWYYPLTDHWFAREIYSEDYLPNEYLNQRFVPYIDDYELLQFDERKLYREVIRGGAFEFMCGAYLIEARVSAQDSPCPVDYAAVTAYREPAKRFVTTVRNDGTACKTQLHKEGLAAISAILRNHRELARLGVNVVPLQLEGNDLVMPRIDFPTLWDYWVQKLINGRFDFNEMVLHFDHIRDAIYKASVNGDCYWELVPANCFYDEANGELTFFDQEYYWDNHPPETALARAVLALKYSNAFTSDSRTQEWISVLKNRYGLSGQWDRLSELIKKANMEVFSNGAETLASTSAKAVERIADRRRRIRFRHAPEKLREMGYRHPVIYGYGRRGKALEYALQKSELKPAAIIDKAHENLSSVDQIDPGSKADVIIVSILDSVNIIDDLRAKTCLPVLSLEELINEKTK